MSRQYSATKHLYTLNDEKDSSEEVEVSEADSLEDELGIDFDDVQRDNKRLTKKNEDLQRKISDLHLKNQQLCQLTQLTERRNVKHEQKQRELIKTLSYYQVSSQQLASEVNRMQQDTVEMRENKKISDGHINQLKSLIKRTQGEKDRFLGFLRNLLEMLRRCDAVEEYEEEREKIMQFISRNISHSEQPSKVTHDFDFKFELSRVDTLKEKIRSLEREVNETHEDLNRERGERKKLMSVYTQKICRLKELHEDLKAKVQSQEQEHRRKIKSMLSQKNQTIQTLKCRLKESRVRKSSMEGRRSQQSKSYIGDGDYSHLELTELNDAIENLEMQIIKQFEE